MFRLPAFPCLTARQIPAALSSASRLCPRQIDAAPSALPCLSVRGRWRWCGAVGCPGWLWRSGLCWLAGMGAPAARRGSGRGPRPGPAAGDGFGIFRYIQPCYALRRFTVGPSGRSLPRFPALPCCTLWQIPAALPALPCGGLVGVGNWVSVAGHGGGIGSDWEQCNAWSGFWCSCSRLRLPLRWR